MPPDLAALIRRAGAGDQPAFAALYDELAPTVYGVVRRFVASPTAAAAVSTDVFLELWRNAARFNTDCGDVRAWAAVVAYRHGSRAADSPPGPAPGRRRAGRDRARGHGPHGA
ncbi:sigma factor [Desertimonas flava]|uniref:sigma factor n=1 Tax=Desertimonas flava TaxID=2064846 RepID=UPI0013C49F75|nr:sigma factor [Desertimonas flava]